jgi:hypothetical protein
MVLPPTPNRRSYRQKAEGSVCLNLQSGHRVFTQKLARPMSRTASRNTRRLMGG